VNVSMMEVMKLASLGFEVEVFYSSGFDGLLMVPFAFSRAFPDLEG
jgi:hypothetical protein